MTVRSFFTTEGILISLQRSTVFLICSGVVPQQPPRIVDGLYSLAQLHEKRGEYEAAIRANERILECLNADYEITEGEQADSRRREIQRLSKLI